MLLLSCTLFSIVFCTTECAKILGVFHVPGTSHHLSASTLMKILAEKGHDVTIIATIPEKNPPKNYKEIILTGIMDKMQDKFKKRNFFEIQMNPLITPIFFATELTEMVEDAFNHTNFKEFMKSTEKFDAVIIEEFNSEALKYVAHHFDAPLIVYNAIDANEFINPYQGNPDSPAYTPNLHLPYPSSDMSFIQRVCNSIFYVYTNLVRTFYTIPIQNEMLHKYYPDAPHLNDIIYNVSLVLLNADPSVHDPLPKVPSMVNIGGFHVKKPKPLSKDLQELMDKAEHGVVYFSMGSNLKSKDIPEEKRKFLLETFSKLKQTVLWKFEDDNLPGRPGNVVTRKWFPQNDILAHKNVKLFITHGGIFSTMEAVYHGVPLLALPVWVEQHLNSKKAAFHGYAEYVSFKDLQADTFALYLNELLQNPKYKENAVRRSEILRDKPIPPTEAVNYWVEYVIRHKGASHLRVAALNLAWYQYLLLDVVVFVIVVILILIKALKYFFKVMLKGKSNKKQKTT